MAQWPLSILSRQQKCLQDRVPLPPKLMSRAALELTRMTIAAYTKEEGLLHLVFVLQSRRRFCVHVHSAQLWGQPQFSWLDGVQRQTGMFDSLKAASNRLIYFFGLLRITSSRRTIRHCTSPGNITCTAKPKESVQNRKQCLETSCTSSKGKRGGK